MKKQNCQKVRFLEEATFRRTQKWSTIMSLVTLGLLIAMLGFMIYGMLAHPLLPAEICDGSCQDFHWEDAAMAICAVGAMPCVLAMIFIIRRLGAFRCKSCGHIYASAPILAEKTEYADGCLRFQCPHCKERTLHELLQRDKQNVKVSK